MDRLIQLLTARSPERLRQQVRPRRLPPRQHDRRADRAVYLGGARLGTVQPRRPLADVALILTYWHDQGDEERAPSRWPSGSPPSWASPPPPTWLRPTRTSASSTVHLTLAAMKLADDPRGRARPLPQWTTVDGGYESAGAAIPLRVARGLRLLAQRTTWCGLEIGIVSLSPTTATNPRRHAVSARR
jgi:hypothetical protein